MSAFVWLLLCQCSREVFTNENPIPDLDNRVQLTYGPPYSIQLDDRSSHTSRTVAYHPQSERALFSRLNSTENAIYLHDFPSGEIRRIIHFERQGDQGVGQLEGYTFLNEDSIYVYSRQKRLLALADSSGRVRARYPLTFPDASAELIRPIPTVSTPQPMLIGSEALTLVGYLNGEFAEEQPGNRPVQIQFSLRDSSLRFGVSYPAFYNGHNWFGAHMRHVYATADAERQHLVYSFPADHYLQVYTADGHSARSVYAGSRAIDAILSTTKHWFYDKSARFRYYATTPSYASIIFDPYRELYYYR